MKFIVIIAICFLIVCVSHTDALVKTITASQCTTLGGVRYGQFCYSITSSGNWATVRNTCRNQGGDLASIRSAAEFANVLNFTRTQVPGVIDAWIGLNDLDVEGVLVWSDFPAYPVLTNYSTLSVDNQYHAFPYGPDNSGGAEDCVHMSIMNTATPAWNDNNCAAIMIGVCKYVVESTTSYCTSLGSASDVKIVGNNCYWRPTTTSGFAAAATTCRDAGGDLITPRNATHQSEIVGTGLTTQIWSGITSAISYGVWRWADDGTVMWLNGSAGVNPNAGSYTNWGSNQPDNGGERCVSYDSNVWHDYGCTVLRPTLCQIPLGPNCTVTKFTPYLNTNTSTVSNGNTLVLDFVTTSAYTSTSVTFVGAPNVACNSLSAPYWSNIASSSCAMTYRASLPLNFALANCSFTRDESTAGTTVYSSNIKITTVEPLPSVRGLTLIRTLETGVNVQLAFSTAITATSGNLNVYGPHITYARVVSQTFNPVTYAATLSLLTSSQFPYQMTAPTFSGIPVGFTATVVPTTAESGQSTKAVCTGGASPACAQYWTVTISRTSHCSPGPSDLNFANWNVTLTANCHSSFTGSCSTPAPSASFVMFGTNSDDYCPRLIDTESSTASLSAYNSASYIVGNIQTQFVFGSRSFFQAVVVSPIVIDTLRIERVNIVSGGASAGQLMYQATFGSAATYFTAANLNGGTYTNSVNLSPSLMQVADNQTLASNLQRAVTFSWVWSSVTSSATGDNPQAAVVQVDLRIRYRNQSTVAADNYQTQALSIKFNAVDTKLRQHAARVRLMGDDGASTFTSVEVTGASGGDNNNNNGGVSETATAASSSSVPVALVVAGVVGVIVAALAVIVIVGVVYKEKRASTNKLVSSSTVELRSSA